MAQARAAGGTRGGPPPAKGAVSVTGYFGRIYGVSRSVLVGMGVTLKHMLTPGTIITKQYIGLKTPTKGFVAKVLGVTAGYGIGTGHDKCLVCQAAKKLGMAEPDTHDASRDPEAAYGVYDRYYRTGTQITEPKALDYLPPRHRGLHYLETEKCIMCFQCARACPVDCIDIEGTRDGDVQAGHRGDKCTMTRFTIDYALCIFCDLCTLACPDKQVCIHMGKEFDLTAYDQGHLVKNLLTDDPFSRSDRSFVLEARVEIDRLADEKKKAREAARKAATAPKAAAAAAAPAAPAAKKPEENK